MKKRISASWVKVCFFLLCLSTIVFLAGCGGGKPEAVWNITDSWFIYHNVNGTTGEQGPDLFLFTQTSDNDISGTTPDGEAFTGTISGTDVSFIWTGSDAAVYTYNGTVSNGNMDGTWSANNGQSGNWHAIVDLPPGLSVAGSWNVFQTVTGSTEQGPEVFALQQSGNSISGTAPAGSTVTGNIGSNYFLFTWIGSDNNSYVYIGTASDSSHMSGTWTNSAGQSGTWRATKN